MDGDDLSSAQDHGRRRQRLSVDIRGAVQGVGFRPFVFRLASELGLDGWVRNDSRGVAIEVEGDRWVLESFLERLPSEAPEIAIIQHLEVAWHDAAGLDGFCIDHTDAGGAKTVLVLPDIATCPRCVAEIRAIDDRRFGYPFTNCTDCGPRFSIIEALPYDRPNTTMRHFAMCDRCRAEYEDPTDRRFHAQPNACSRCGPCIELCAADGAQQAAGEAALEQAAAALVEGQVLALKGLGGFHLMVDARNDDAVATLRRRKARPSKPLALMVGDIAQARAVCEVSVTAARTMKSARMPIVLLPRNATCRRGVESGSMAADHRPIAEGVSPDTGTLGVMLPYTPLHHLLFDTIDFPVVATSGNLSDEPICIDNDEALGRLAGIADLFLLHDRPITRHVDDSVVWIVDGEAQPLRRARGLAPLPVVLAAPVPPILAVGAHLKNAVALSVDDKVFISQPIGDMETAEAFDAFERVIGDFLRLYDVEPHLIAHDLHPDYLSTQWARRVARTDRDSGTRSSAPASGWIADLRGVPLVGVQHHHAHLAACLAEHAVEGPALGVTWDGTGYGTDGTVWGGEFLVGDARDFERVAHLRPFRLPGAQAAVHEPRRVALALLWEAFGEAALERGGASVSNSFAGSERRVLLRMLESGFRTPWTSSAGRLFDGVAALVGLYPKVSYEGQAAISLERVVDPSVRDAYPLPAVDSPSETGVRLVLDWQPMVEEVLRDCKRDLDLGIIAARFINGLVEAIVTVAGACGQPRVALTGGCFQNRWLVERATARLRAQRFEVLLHRQVPPNDGGISLGQVAVAAARRANE